MKDAKEYFQLAIDNNPANYLIKSLFAMFLDDCGLLAQVITFSLLPLSDLMIFFTLTHLFLKKKIKLKKAELQFLETLEIAPNFAFGLVQYAQFLVKRGAMASATAMLKRVKGLFLFYFYFLFYFILFFNTSFPFLFF